MPNEYRIERVSDFLRIPQDRLVDCLFEFMNCLMLVHEAREKGFNAGLIGFTWTDDGKKEIAEIEYCIECACCHQIVGVSDAVLQDGQNLCKSCASTPEVNPCQQSKS